MGSIQWKAYWFGYQIAHYVLRLRAWAHRGPRLTLYADGLHDDTEALQAWLDGGVVFKPDGNVVPRAISQGKFSITSPLRFGKSTRELIAPTILWNVPSPPNPWS